jgi:hypothetical protein
MWKKYRFVIMASGYLLKKPMKGGYNKEEICLTDTRPYIEVGASNYDKFKLHRTQLPDEIDPNLLMYVRRNNYSDGGLLIAFSDMNQLK